MPVKRTRHGAEFKAKVALEAIKGQKTAKFLEESGKADQKKNAIAHPAGFVSQGFYQIAFAHSGRAGVEEVLAVGDPLAGEKRLEQCLGKVPWTKEVEILSPWRSRRGAFRREKSRKEESITRAKGASRAGPQSRIPGRPHSVHQ